MSTASAFGSVGQARTKGLVNVRHAVPATSGSITAKLGGGSLVTVLAIVPGEIIQDNPHWYQIDPQSYIWSGGCQAFTATAGPPASPPVTPSPALSLSVGAPTMTDFVGKGTPLTQAGLNAALAPIGATAEALWSVLSVETSGCGFLPDRRPKILFERHIFSRLTGGKWDVDDPDISAKTPGGYGPSGTYQYVRLQSAMQLDASAALMSASWGLGQIMGENHKKTGFANVEGMVAAFVSGEDAQLLGMANFIRYSGMAPALQACDWPTFARRYNGPNYAAHNYDGHLASFHAHVTASGLPDFGARACQVYLTYKGYRPGHIDGVAGAATINAVKAFQQASGLAPTGVIDAGLLSALAT